MKRLSSIVFLILISITTAIPQTKNAESSSTREKQESDRGVFAQLVKVRVNPGDIEKWENSVSKLARAAEKSRVSEKIDWLIYRETPTNYHIVLISDSLAEMVTTDSFPTFFAGEESEKLFTEGMKELMKTEFEILENIVTQQVYSLGTVRSMTTKTHPLGRSVNYWIKPDKEAEFVSALQEYASFLKEIKYPYPVEGFRYALFSPGRYMVVTFPDDWAKFYRENDLETLARKKNALNKLSEIKRRINSTLIRISVDHISFAPELSPGD